MTLFMVFFGLAVFAYFMKTALDPRTALHQKLCTRCKRRREYMS